MYVKMMDFQENEKKVIKLMLVKLIVNFSIIL